MLIEYPILSGRLAEQIYLFSIEKSGDVDESILMVGCDLLLVEFSCVHRVEYEEKAEI